MPRKKKNKNNKNVEIKTVLEVEEMDEEVEVVEKTNEIKFECPVCKQLLEMQNELVIKKKGDCLCKCTPFAFKLSRKDKSLSIDKKENGDINVETEIHDITFKWGRGITPTEDNTSLETVKCVMDKPFKE